MCLIALAVDPPGPWSLMVAANRDEFHDRLAAPASWWDATGVADAGGPAWLFGGRDLQGGGTWLGLRRVADGSLRMAALTNLRPGLMPAAALMPVEPGAPPSRGKLVCGYLSSESDPGNYLRTLDPPPGAFAGFNLLAISVAPPGGVVEGWYLNNLPGAQARRLTPGLHLVSNATLDVPWPKTRLLEAAMLRALAGGSSEAEDEARQAAARPETRGDEWQLAATLLAALGDRTEAAESELPRTGLCQERERLLSSPFIVDGHYGTRCSTVLLVSRGGQVHYVERSFGPHGRHLGTVTERFVTA